MIVELERPSISPAMTRLSALSPMDDGARRAVEQAIERARKIASRRELVTEGREVREPLLLLRGWAARVRILGDGRRQILNFVVPGDLIGLCAQDRPIAPSTIVAITPVVVCAAPDAATSPALAQAYAVGAAREEAYLLAQIARLGRLNAHERITDLLLELLDRLQLAGLATRGRFELPLTQETLADALGLTAVHVNRMIQQARRAGELTWQSKEITIHDPATLARQVGHLTVKVTAD